LGNNMSMVRTHFDNIIKGSTQPHFCVEDTQCILRKSGAGFTLVEMLVSVSIFAVVVLIAVGTLIVLINAGSVAQRSQVTAANLSFTLDSMARTIRTGYEYYCTNGVPSSLPDGTKDCENGARTLVFTNGETGQRMAYSHDSVNDAIRQITDTPGSDSWINLTSPDLAIERMEFHVDHTDNAPGDLEQPSVRILVEGRFTGASLTEAAPFYIQTIVTSRYLDF